ncbi:MAG: hypothetical protein LW834_07945 [Cyanobium sp. 49614_E6]|jgi:hypothetical protein|nr:hypothetical protein [Cyanobium sp. 49614_E6]
MSVYYDLEACHDCIAVHGDTRQQWLADWPQGAEYRPDQHVHLCDGCYDDRIDHLRASREP